MPSPRPPAPAFDVTMDQGDKEGVTHVLGPESKGRTNLEGAPEMSFCLSDATCHPVFHCLSQGIVPGPPSSDNDKWGV